jgi:hypothetical protein
MIDFTLDTAHSILVLRPQAALEADDFDRLAKAVDPFIEQNGNLAGIIVEAPSFPGWKTFDAFVHHFRFVRDHHRHIRRVALVTDSAVGALGENLASHFVAAEIRRFPAGGFEAAQRWILEGAEPSH